MPSITVGNAVTSPSQVANDTISAAAIQTDAVDTAEIKSGAVKTDEIFDGTIVDADISSSAAIALSKMAAGTQGAVLIRGAAGVLTELPAGTTDYYLAGQGAGVNPTWKVFASPISTVVSTFFEASGRLTTALLGGTTSSSVGIGTTGLRLYKHYTYGINAVSAVTQLVGKASTLYLGSPTFSTRVLFTLISNSAGSMYLGLGNPTVATTGHTFTVGHTGFKVIRSGGVNTLYATQADGAAETVSSALTTIADGDEMDLVLRVNGTASVDYYWRKNGGALSSATNLTTNMPAGTSQQAQFSISCNNVDDQAIDMTVGNASYIR